MLCPPTCNSVVLVLLRHALKAFRFCWRACDHALQALKADTDKKIKAIAVVHNETATGVTSDLLKIRETIDACGHPALFMVDGVSSIGALDFQMDKWKIDIAVTGSQKALSLPTGLAVVAVSDKVMFLHGHTKPPCLPALPCPSSSPSKALVPPTGLAIVSALIRQSRCFVTFDYDQSCSHAYHLHTCLSHRGALLNSSLLHLCKADHAGNMWRHSRF